MHVVFEHTCNNVARYFGAAKDLPGVRELFEQEREFAGLFNSLLLIFVANVLNLYGTWPFCNQKAF